MIFYSTDSVDACLFGRDVAEEFTCIVDEGFNRCLKKGSALSEATYKRDIRCMRLLIKSGAKIAPDADLLSSIGYYSPLEYAILVGSIEALDLLLDSGADIETTNHAGNTLLAFACIKDRLIISKHLVTRGAKTTVVDMDEDNILHLIIWHTGRYGNKEWQEKVPKTLKFILEVDASLLNQTNNDDYTPYLLACSTGNQDIMDFFKSKGARVNQKLCEMLCKQDRAITLHGECSPFSGIY